MRLLGVLALAAPVALGTLLIVDPTAFVSWADEGSRSMVAMLVAAIVGVSLTALVVSGYLRFRFVALVKAAEQIAAGDYSTAVAVRGKGLETRLATAINGIASAFADTHDLATIDRLTGVANRQVLLSDLFSEVERASRSRIATRQRALDISPTSWAVLYRSPTCRSVGERRSGTGD